MRCITLLKGVVGGVSAVAYSVGISRLIYNRCNEGRNNIGFRNSYPSVSLDVPITTSTDYALPENPAWTSTSPLWTPSCWPMMLLFISIMAFYVSVIIYVIGSCIWINRRSILGSPQQTRYIFIESLMTHLELVSAEASPLQSLAYYVIFWGISYVRMQDLATSNERLQDEFGRSETMLEKSQLTIEQQREEILRRARKLDARRQSYQENIRAKDDQISQKTQELDAQRQSYEENIRVKDDLISQNARNMDAQRQSHEDNINGKDQEISRLQSEILQAKKDLDEKTSSDNKRQTTISELIRERDKAAQIHQARSAEHNRLRTENATLKNDVKRAQDTGVTMMDKANKLKGQLADVEARLEAELAASAEAETEAESESETGDTEGSQALPAKSGRKKRRRRTRKNFGHKKRGEPDPNKPDDEAGAAVTTT